MLLQQRKSDHSDHGAQQKETLGGIAQQHVDRAGNEQHDEHGLGRDFGNKREEGSGIGFRSEIGTLRSQALPGLRRRQSGMRVFVHRDLVLTGAHAGSAPGGTPWAVATAGARVFRITPRLFRVTGAGHSGAGVG